MNTSVPHSSNGSNPLSPSRDGWEDPYAVVDNNLDTPDQVRAEVMGPPRFRPHSLADLRRRPPKQWHIERVVGEGDTVLIVGPPGSAKTHAVIDLIFAGCTGNSFAGRFAVKRPLNIAYCAGEGVSGIAQRFAAVAEVYGVDDLPNLAVFDVVPQLSTGKDSIPGLPTIQDFVAEWRFRQSTGDAQPLDILIIDTLHSATIGADENSARDMGLVLEAARYATRNLGCAVILVHHAGKSGDYRGSSAILGSADTMIEFRPLGSKFAMSCRKLKDGAPWDDQTFDLICKLDSVYVSWDEARDTKQAAAGKQDRDVEHIVAVLCDMHPTPLPATRLSESLGMGPGNKQIYALLKRAEDAGRVKKQLLYPDREASRYNPWVYSPAPPELHLRSVSKQSVSAESVLTEQVSSVSK